MRIKNFSIENYRSLKHLEISDFGTTTIFYGENNAGKSNILNALALIFGRKPKLVSGENLSEVENFYEGVILNSQNTYFNNEVSNSIKFSIGIEVLKSELTIAPEIKPLFHNEGSFLFTFEGSMSFLGEGDQDYSDFKIDNVKKGKILIYTTVNDVSFFPSLDKDKTKQPQLSKAFTQLMNIFNDCVFVVSSDRDMHETSMPDNDTKQLTPRTFKQYLYSLYLSPKKFSLFEEINSVYSQDPFNFGTISFSKDGDNLEIMIKEKDFRLPIKHLGAGALQALYIITSIVCSSSAIVCLEELEQNLSPRKQFEILKKIQIMTEDPKLAIKQLILSSHSSVYAKPKLGMIYFLEKENGRTSINQGETEKISNKLKRHIAISTSVWDEGGMKQIRKILKEEHDFE